MYYDYSGRKYETLGEVSKANEEYLKLLNNPEMKKLKEEQAILEQQQAILEQDKFEFYERKRIKKEKIKENTKIILLLVGITALTILMFCKWDMISGYRCEMDYSTYKKYVAYYTKEISLTIAGMIKFVNNVSIKETLAIFCYWFTFISIRLGIIFGIIRVIKIFKRS